MIYTQNCILTHLGHNKACFKQFMCILYYAYYATTVKNYPLLTILADFSLRKVKYGVFYVNKYAESRVSFRTPPQ